MSTKKKSNKHKIKLALLLQAPVELAPHVVRCHDDGCPERRDCRRFLESDWGAPQRVHARSLNPVETRLGMPCAYKIQAYTA